MLRFITALSALTACALALTFLLLVQLEPFLVGYATIYAPAAFCLAMLTVVPLAWRTSRYLLGNRFSI